MPLTRALRQHRLGRRVFEQRTCLLDFARVSQPHSCCIRHRRTSRCRRVRGRSNRSTCRRHRPHTQNRPPRSRPDPNPAEQTTQAPQPDPGSHHPPPVITATTPDRACPGGTVGDHCDNSRGRARHVPAECVRKYAPTPHRTDPDRRLAPADPRQTGPDHRQVGPNVRRCVRGPHTASRRTSAKRPSTSVTSAGMCADVRTDHTPLCAGRLVHRGRPETTRPPRER